MRKAITTTLLAGALAMMSGAAFAASPAVAQSKPAAKSASTKPAATHATTGVVKTIDANTLVITRAGKSPAEMTFSLNASTHREGTIVAGSPVSVRYQREGTTDVATAITMQQTKTTAANKAAKK